MHEEVKQGVVLLMGRDPGSLSDEQHGHLKARFPQGYECVRIDAPNYLDHAELCRVYHPDVVILPMDRPIPTQAMEEGFEHVVLTDEGMKKLIGIQPLFVPYP